MREAATKVNNHRYPSHRRKSTKFPLDFRERGSYVSIWLPCFKSCIDKCEIQRRLPGHWGSGDHTCGGVDNLTNALPTVGD